MNRLNLNGAIPIGKGTPVARVLITLYDGGQMGLESPLSPGDVLIVLEKIKAQLVPQVPINIPPPAGLPLPKPPE